MKYRIVCDLDDTLCFPNHNEKTTSKKYSDSLPNERMINYINLRKSKGDYIIIHTARRMLSHNGNIKLIKEDVEKITVNWLAKYNVQYDELIFGKPYGDVYIDDKALNIKDIY